MRICLISREYPPDTGFGGIATFANHLALGLTSLGHEVEVIALAKDRAKTVVTDGVVIHRVEAHEIEGSLGAVALCMPYSRYVLRSSSALWKKFSELHSQRPFDVVDSPELLAEGIMPAITKVAPLLIRLYTPHSKFIAEQLHNVTASFDHQFVALMERAAMLSADVITSPSDDLADFVARDLNFPREAIRIVRNPIDPEQFSPEGDKAIASDGRPIVLFIGRLEERKGIAYLIDAIPRVVKVHPTVRFVIVGDDTNNGRGQRSVLAELKESIRFFGLESYVEFIPRVPLSELPNYYRSADISVVPSVYDNSPYTCLEAMSCGKPVIGTSSGGTPEYMVDGESGVIVPPRDSEAIACALIRLLQDKKEQKRLGDNARARVLLKFDRQEIARQTLELYNEAQVSFQARGQTKLYRKAPEEALPDTDALLYSFDTQLYSFLYAQSLRFRLKHWSKLIRNRPRLSLAMIFVRVAKLAFNIMGIQPEKARALVHRLDAEISLKQRQSTGDT